MHAQYAALHSHTAVHHAIEMASGQRAPSSATHKGHRRISLDIWVDPRVGADV
jgi:hypothetical protein